MPAIHSDCRYAIRGDQVPVAGTQYTTKGKTQKSETISYAPEGLRRRAARLATALEFHSQ